LTRDLPIEEGVARFFFLSRDGRGKRRLTWPPPNGRGMSRLPISTTKKRDASPGNLRYTWLRGFTPTSCTPNGGSRSVFLLKVPFQPGSPAWGRREKVAKIMSNLGALTSRRIVARQCAWGKQKNPRRLHYVEPDRRGIPGLFAKPVPIGIRFFPSRWTWGRQPSGRL